MKCAIVTKALLDENNRWDAGFYLGEVSGAESLEAIERAKVQVKRANTTLANREREYKEGRDRVSQLVAEGKVTPIE